VQTLVVIPSLNDGFGSGASLQPMSVHIFITSDRAGFVARQFPIGSSHRDVGALPLFHGGAGMTKLEPLD